MEISIDFTIQYIVREKKAGEKNIRKLRDKPSVKIAAAITREGSKPHLIKTHTKYLLLIFCSCNMDI